MECRPLCGACCIAISISSSIPGMPDGKPAGTRCIHLTDDFKCALFGHPSRPAICSKFLPEILICGNSQQEALQIISELEGISPPLI